MACPVLNTLYIHIGKNIRIGRKLKGLTQEELGEKINLPGERIRQYKGSVRTPKPDYAIKIADALEISHESVTKLDPESGSSIMHFFFDLEDKYGLHVERIGEQYYLSFEQDGSNKYSNRLYSRLESWYFAQQKYKLNNNDSMDTIKQKKDAYNNWRLRYPLDEK